MFDHAAHEDMLRNPKYDFYAHSQAVKEAEAADEKRSSLERGTPEWQAANLEANRLIGKANALDRY